MKIGLHFTQATLMSPVTCHLTTTLTSNPICSLKYKLRGNWPIVPPTPSKSSSAELRACAVRLRQLGSSRLWWGRRAVRVEAVRTVGTCEMFKKSKEVTARSWRGWRSFQEVKVLLESACMIAEPKVNEQYNYSVCKMLYGCFHGKYYVSNI